MFVYACSQERGGRKRGEWYAGCSSTSYDASAMAAMYHTAVDENIPRGPSEILDYSEFYC